MTSPLLDGLREPVVLAPMAGGPSSPALAAAVSDAGGLAFLAGGYLAPEALRAQIAAVRELTGAPIGVNLFVPGRHGVAGEAVAAYRDELRADAERAGVALGEPHAEDDGWDDKLAVVREARVAAVSFTFGCPDPSVLADLADAGAETWVTVTNPEEAARAREAGAGALVVQGAEAGGHRGTFDDRDERDLGLLVLIRLVAREVDLPLVAAGGIGDGCDRRGARRRSAGGPARHGVPAGGRGRHPPRAPEGPGVGRRHRDHPGVHGASRPGPGQPLHARAPRRAIRLSRDPPPHGAASRRRPRERRRGRVQPLGRAGPPAGPIRSRR